MTDKRISELTPATAITGSESTLMVQSNITVQSPIMSMINDAFVALPFSIQGKPPTGQIYNWAIPFPITIPANFATTALYVATAATANTQFTVKQISGGITSVVGSITITVGSHTSFTTSTQAAVNFVAGDVLQLVAPTQDATLADLCLTFNASRTYPYTLDLNFAATAALDPRVTFTRSGSGATYFDATNLLQTATANTPRFDYGVYSSGKSNMAPNSMMVGAIVGTPGTVPTGWTVTASNGVTWSVANTGNEAGYPFIDVNVIGTASGRGGGLNFSLSFGTVSVFPGQVWNVSANLRLVAATSVGAATVALRSANIVQIPTVVNPTVTKVNTVCCIQPFFNNQNARFSGMVNVNIPTGSTVNLTFRLGQPQIELGATPNKFIPTYGALVNFGASCLGFLFEQSRTNGITNPRAEGGVIGTPGTPPTNWTFISLSGLSAGISGSGYDTGIPYVDIAFSGTTTSQNTDSFFFHAPDVAATQDQVFTSSAYVKIINGTDPGTFLCCSEYDSGGALLVEQQLPITVTTNALATQRSQVTFTVNWSTTAFIRTGVEWNFAANTAVSFTMRIGAPQLELGAYATSVILPPIGAPSVTTRGTETAVVPIGPWFNSTALTVIADATEIISGWSESGGFVELNDGTTSNCITISGDNSLNPLTSASAGGSQIFSVSSLPNITQNVPFKVGISMTSGSQASSANGSTPITSASSLHPTNLLNLNLGMISGGTLPLGQGYIKRVRCIPQISSNSVLQSLTDPQILDTTFDFNFTTSTVLDSRFVYSRSDTSATYFDYSGTMVSVATNQPRFDYDPASLALKGLRIEESRVNSIRNPRAEGAVVGTPGTYPTNIGHSENSSLIPAVAGFGTENGIPYWDVQLVGTATGGQNNIFFETGVAAGASQVWTESVYWRVAAGTLTNVTGINLGINDNAVGGQSANQFPTTAPLGTQRFSFTRTLSGTATTITNAFLQFNIAAGAVNVTLRIGAPQLERGAFATSVILPPIGSPAATTRSIETITLSSALVVPAAGTIAAELLLPAAVACDLVAVDDGTSSNAYILHANTGGSVSGNQYTSNSNVRSVTTSTGRWSSGTAFRSALRYGSDFAVSATGSLPTSSTFTANSSTASIVLGPEQASSPNGHIRRVRYWARALSNTEMQTVTT